MAQAHAEKSNKRSEWSRKHIHEEQPREFGMFSSWSCQREVNANTKVEKLNRYRIEA